MDNMRKPGDIAASAAAKAYWWLMFTLVPLYIDNAYFNISKAKLNMFTVCALVVLAIMLLSAVLKSDRALIPKRDISLYAFLGLGAAALLSCICSYNPRLTFWGFDGWGMGAFTILCLALFVCLLSGNLRFTNDLWLPVMAVSGVVLFIGLLNCAGIDVFGMRVRILKVQYYRYMSTIGHDNWYSGYMCLLVPLFTMLCITCRSKYAKIGYTAYLALAYINLILGTSDGIFPGLGLCAVFAVPFIVHDRIRLRRFCGLTAMFGMIFMFSLLCPWFEAKRASKNGLMLKLYDWRIALAIIVIGAAGYLLLRFGRFALTPRASRVMTIAFESALAAVILYYIIDTALHFDGTWGTDRGYIWKRSFLVFESLSFPKKLVGLGPGGLREMYTQVKKSETVLASHNEAIQYLLSTGIIGLLCWLTAWGGMIASYFRYKLWRLRQGAYFLPIAAYLGQSVVNSPTVTNSVMVFALVAVSIITRPKTDLPTVADTFRKLKAFFADISRPDTSLPDMKKKKRKRK